MPRRLHIVDVFTDKALTGNALSVVLGAQGLSAHGRCSRLRAR